MKVLKRSDRIKVTIFDPEFKAEKPGETAPALLSFYLAPLTLTQKGEIKDCRSMKSGVLVQDGLKAAMLAVKYALKDVDGLEDSEGKAFELAFEKEDRETLAEACVNDLMNIELSTVLMLACTNLINNVYAKLTYPDGIEIPNVSVEIGAKKK